MGVSAKKFEWCNKKKKLLTIWKFARKNSHVSVRLKEVSKSKWGRTGKVIYLQQNQNWSLSTNIEHIQVSILSRGLLFWIDIFEELLPSTLGRTLLSGWFAQECVFGGIFTFRRIVWPSYSASWSLRSLHLFKGQTAAGGCGHNTFWLNNWTIVNTSHSFPHLPHEWRYLETSITLRRWLWVPACALFFGSFQPKV